MHASIRELRLHTKELLDVANRGEEVIVTCRGKAFAKLIPIIHSSPLKNEAFGLWENNAKVSDVEGFISQLRKSRHDDAR